MSAPVTEALRNLVRLISWAGITAEQVEEKAQLIADQLRDEINEWKSAATKAWDERDQLRAEAPTWEAAAAAHLAEVDRLRAEVERLKGEARQEKEHHEFYRGKVSDYMGAEIGWVSRAERAEAELATEQARVDWLERCNNVAIDHSVWADHMPLAGQPIIRLVEMDDDCESRGDAIATAPNLRAALDAAMNEGAK